MSSHVALSLLYSLVYLFFFFNDTATTEIYTLSLHDALPICPGMPSSGAFSIPGGASCKLFRTDRKSTRLNSSHLGISYAVFCLKKKTKLRDAPGLRTPGHSRERVRIATITPGTRWQSNS